jgi:hypothetical protein
MRSLLRLNMEEDIRMNVVVLRSTVGLLGSLAASVPAPAQPVVFGPFGPGGDYRAYRAVLTELEWNATRLDSASRVFLGATGHLASISSSNENSFVASVGGAGDVWIGLTDHEAFGGFEEAGPPCCGGNGTAQTGAGFVWLTGEPKPYQNWNTDEPNNWAGAEDATHIRGDGRWADHSAGAALGQPGPAFKYVVEYPVNWPAASPLPAWRIEVHKANRSRPETLDREWTGKQNNTMRPRLTDQLLATLLVSTIVAGLATPSSAVPCQGELRDDGRPVTVYCADGES